MVSARPCAEPAQIRGQPRGGRRFFLAMGLAMMATVFIGFAPTFYLRRLKSPLSPLLRAHGVVFSLWLVLFILQAALVARDATRLHRRLGVLGAGVALAMLVMGTLVALRSVAGVSGTELQAQLSDLAVPLFDMPVFALLVGAAFARRRVAPVHRRLMLIATIGLLSPAIGRMPWPPSLLGPVSDFVAPDLFLVPLAVSDLATDRKLHRATVAGALLLIGSQALRVAISGTAAWSSFAGWAVGLVR